MGCRRLERLRGRYNEWQGIRQPMLKRYRMAGVLQTLTPCVGLDNIGGKYE